MKQILCVEIKGTGLFSLEMRNPREVSITALKFIEDFYEEHT